MISSDLLAAVGTTGSNRSKSEGGSRQKPAKFGRSPLILEITRNTQSLVVSPPVLDTPKTVVYGCHRLAISVKNFKA